MNIGWVTTKHQSGVQEQSRIIARALDAILISSQPIHTGHDETFITDERGVVHPVSSLTDTLIELGLDVVVFHSFNIAARTALRAVHPYVVTVVRLGVNIHAELLYGKYSHVPDILDCLNLADHVVASGSHPASVLEAMGYDRFTIIPSAIDYDSVEKPKTDPPRTVGTIGRIDNGKNQFFSLEVANGVKNFNWDLAPDLILSGHQNDQMLDTMHDAAHALGYPRVIKWTGHVDSPSESFYPHVGVHLHPSYTENCPQTVLEAAVAGVPTITSNAKWATDFDAMLQAPLDDPIQWSAFVHELFTDNDMYRKVVNKQQGMLKKHHVSVVKKRYKSLFNDLDDALIAKIPPGVIP